MSGKGAKGLSGKGLSGKGAKGTMSSKKGDKRKPTSRSVKAGLQFPVGRIHRFLKVWIFFHIPIIHSRSFLITSTCGTTIFVRKDRLKIQNLEISSSRLFH
jgi:hypothetical protein|tara:strand:- start:258 stop:560 length:303 start_codon:yes stop_codon:yes gene_type:complete